MDVWCVIAGVVKGGWMEVWRKEGMNDWMSTFFSRAEVSFSWSAGRILCSSYILSFIFCILHSFAGTRFWRLTWVPTKARPCVRSLRKSEFRQGCHVIPTLWVAWSSESSDVTSSSAFPVPRIILIILFTRLLLAYYCLEVWGENTLVLQTPTIYWPCPQRGQVFYYALSDCD